MKGHEKEKENVKRRKQKSKRSANTPGEVIIDKTKKSGGNMRKSRNKTVKLPHIEMQQYSENAKDLLEISGKMGKEWKKAMQRSM